MAFVFCYFIKELEGIRRNTTSENYRNFTSLHLTLFVPELLSLGSKDKKHKYLFIMGRTRSDINVLGNSSCANLTSL